MIENFQNYLRNNPVKILKESTIKDYTYRLEGICKRENITLNEIAKNIDFYVEDYGPKGNNSEYGKKSNRAYISALKRLKEFLR